MKRRKITGMLMSVIMILSMMSSAGANVVVHNKSTQKTISSQSGEYIIMANNNASKQKIKEELNLKINKYSKLSDEQNVNVAEITEAQATKLKNDKNVKIIEKNIQLKGSGNIVNPEQVNANWNIELINAEREKRKIKKNKIKVAIIDSGIDECEGIDVIERTNLIPEEKNISPCFDDTSGHGTAIAGIIAGKKVEDREVEGINDDVALYSIKVLDGNNTTTLDRVIEGIYKAIEYDVDIINMSFGTTVNSQILHSAIQKAYDKGILMVAAAGNRGKSDKKVEYPAAYDEVISVGSIDANGNVAESSSIGEKVDIMAPGEMIKTVADFGFETVSSGTSLAVPHVVGVASILWQKDRNKSQDFIMNLIKQTANQKKINGKEYSIVDLEYALEKYEEYSEHYSDKKYTIEINQSDLKTNEDMIELTGAWSRDNHASLVTNNKNVKLTTKEVNMIKAGIRYNDRYLSPDANTQNRRIWHSLGQESNFMSAIYYVGKVIQETNCNPNNVTKTPGLTTGQYNQMKSDIKAINWNNVLQISELNNNATNYPNNIKNKRLLLFGMTLHIVTDAFAHKAYKRKPYLSGASMSHWEHVSDTDNTNEVPSRYKAAGKVVKNAMEQCLRFESGSVVMKNTYTIRSRQIMEGNTYFDTSFLIGYLLNNAAANKANDTTYATWEGKLRANTYDANLS